MSSLVLQKARTAKLREERGALAPVPFANVTFQGYMYRLAGNGSGFARRQYLILVEDYLALVNKAKFDREAAQKTDFTPEAKIEVGWAAVQFDRKSASSEANDMQFPFGISFARGADSIKFFLINEEAFEAWARVLRRVCIQRCFQQSFCLEHPIGRGSTSTVYRARCLKTGRSFAVKRFKKKKLCRDEEQQRALASEVDIQREMSDHPHVARLEQVFETDDDVFVVMEAATGGRAFQMPFRPESVELRQTVIALLSVLDSLQARGLMHRDLKPDNLLIQKTENSVYGTLKVIDFGLAARCESDYVFTRCGTIGYVAPEILNTEGRSFRVTPAVDVFSVGIILFNHVTRSKAFAGATKSETLDNNRANNIDFGHPAFQSCPSSRLLKSPRPHLPPYAERSAEANQRRASSATRVLETVHCPFYYFTF